VSASEKAGDASVEHAFRKGVGGLGSNNTRYYIAQSEHRSRTTPAAENKAERRHKNLLTMPGTQSRTERFGSTSERAVRFEL
jgi:hypothetical protein